MPLSSKQCHGTMSQEVAPGRRRTISPTVRHGCHDALKASTLADWCSRGAPVVWVPAAMVVMAESSNNFATVQIRVPGDDFDSYIQNILVRSCAVCAPWERRCVLAQCHLGSHAMLAQQSESKGRVLVLFSN
jgi:hypothetical protein